MRWRTRKRSSSRASTILLPRRRTATTRRPSAAETGGSAERTRNGLPTRTRRIGSPTARAAIASTYTSMSGSSGTDASWPAAPQRATRPRPAREAARRPGGDRPRTGAARAGREAPGCLALSCGGSERTSTVTSVTPPASKRLGVTRHGADGGRHRGRRARRKRGGPMVPRARPAGGRHRRARGPVPGLVPAGDGRRGSGLRERAPRARGHGAARAPRPDGERGAARCRADAPVDPRPGLRGRDRSSDGRRGGRRQAPHRRGLRPHGYSGAAHAPCGDAPRGGRRDARLAGPLEAARRPGRPRRARPPHRGGGARRPGGRRRLAGVRPRRGVRRDALSGAVRRARRRCRPQEDGAQGGRRGERGGGRAVRGARRARGGGARGARPRAVGAARRGRAAQARRHAGAARGEREARCSFAGGVGGPRGPPRRVEVGTMQLTRTMVAILLLSGAAAADEPYSKDLAAGDRHRERGELRVALAHYRAALSEGAPRGEALRRVGETEERLGNWKQAEEAYQAALAANPRDGEARDDLKGLRLRRGLAVRADLGGTEPSTSRQAFEGAIKYGGVERTELVAGYSYSDQIYYQSNRGFVTAYRFYGPDGSWVKGDFTLRRYSYPTGANLPQPDSNAYDWVPRAEAEVSHVFSPALRAGIQYQLFPANFLYDKNSWAVNNKLSGEVEVRPVRALRLTGVLAAL